MLGSLPLLCGCGPHLEYFSPDRVVKAQELLDRADHVFVGVVENQEIASWPLFRFNIPGEDPANMKYWKILRRGVRIEMVLLGAETRKIVDIYEIYWLGGAMGDSNYTENGERAVFLVRATIYLTHKGR